MNKLLYSLLIYSSTFAAIDTGTGADGSCNWTGAIPSQTYNCTDLTISGAVNITGTNPLIIKVQGDVNINATLTLSGQTGAAGGVAVAGGYDGGAPSTNGSGPSAGTFGLLGGDATSNVNLDPGGGGGSGGSSRTLGSAGVTGTITNGADVAGVGGAAPSSVFNLASTLSTSVSGGASGGGGGQDADNPDPGGRGGAGGGILKISANGDILINAAVSANGGAGDNGLGHSGGGGGGAGGVIFFETNGDITNTASVSAEGGAGGTGAGNGGNGGAGGNGVIRFDDYDGVIEGAGSTTPAANTNALHVTTGTLDFTSDISPGCALRENTSHEAQKYFFSLLLLTVIFVFHHTLKKLNIK